MFLFRRSAKGGESKGSGKENHGASSDPLWETPPTSPGIPGKECPEGSATKATLFTPGNREDSNLASSTDLSRSVSPASRGQFMVNIPSKDGPSSSGLAMASDSSTSSKRNQRRFRKHEGKDVIHENVTEREATLPRKHDKSETRKSLLNKGAPGGAYLRRLRV